MYSEIYSYAPELLKFILAKSASKIYNLKKNIHTERAFIFTNTFQLDFKEKYLAYSSFFYEKKLIDIIQKMHIIKYTDNYNNMSALDNALKFDFLNYLPNNLLVKTDMASMAHGLELRSPFLDKNMLELSARIEDKYKIKIFDKKFILKKMLIEKVYLPKNIINRKKMGFNYPLELFIKYRIKNSDEINLIMDSKIMSYELFNKNKLHNYLKYAINNIKLEKNRIFSLMSLASWSNEYL